MEILGYSERGLINSLCYELKYAQNNLGLLDDLLSLVSFPYRKVNFKISEAKIIIEQSFSDFGDADLVLLVRNGETKQIVFIEAKVKKCQRAKWNIIKEFDEFKNWTGKTKVSSSNLFVQLYHKVRLLKTLQSGGINQLQTGVNFPKCSSKPYRKIGKNQVVLNAVQECMSYCKEAFFIALLPENDSALRNFYNNTLKNYSPGGFQQWNIRDWGYVSWEQVEGFCRTNNFDGTLKNMVWNQGQIY